MVNIKKLQSIFTKCFKALNRYPHLSNSYAPLQNEVAQINPNSTEAVSDITAAIVKVTEPLQVAVNSPQVAAEQLGMNAQNQPLTVKDLNQIKSSLHKLCVNELADMQRMYSSSTDGTTPPSEDASIRTFCDSLNAYNNFVIARGMMA